MKRTIAIAKSILILGLATLAVFQVSQLWLVNLTNRNFFIYLQARFPPAAPDGQRAFARPFRIVYGAGNDRFNVKYSGIATSEMWAFGEAALEAIFTNGERVILPDAAQFDIAQVLRRPVLFYEYAFDMCAENFVRALGHPGNDLLASAGISAFNAVAVQPPSERDGLVRVFFIGSFGVYQFIAPFDRRIDIPFVSDIGKHFVAAPGGFMPNVPWGGFPYSTVIVENPFRDAHGLLTLFHIRGRVVPFFANPATINPSVSAGVYTFSNMNTMVRYLENHVLEYTNYRTIGRGIDVDIMTDFSAALAFVAADPYVTNEFFLRRYEPRGREHVFWFDYVIDNRPLILTDEWHTRPYPLCNDPLIAPIEVTVDHGRVVRYRRLAHTFHVGGPSWMSASAMEIDEPFFLGFPIGFDTELSLAVFLE